MKHKYSHYYFSPMPSLHDNRLFLYSEKLGLMTEIYFQVEPLRVFRWRQELIGEKTLSEDWKKYQWKDVKDIMFALMRTVFDDVTNEIKI